MEISTSFCFRYCPAFVGRFFFVLPGELCISRARSYIGSKFPILLAALNNINILFQILEKLQMRRQKMEDVRTQHCHSKQKTAHSKTSCKGTMNKFSQVIALHGLHTHIHIASMLFVFIVIYKITIYIEKLALTSRESLYLTFVSSLSVKLHTTFIIHISYFVVAF